MDTKKKQKIRPFAREGFFEDSHEYVPKNRVGKGVQSFFEGVDNQIFGQREFRPEKYFPPERIKPKRVENLVFSYKENYESKVVQLQVKQVVEEVKKQVFLLEKENKALMNDVAKITVEDLPNKPGIYHLRFFEWLLNILRDLRKKVGESRTWLAAMTSKRQKRKYWFMAKKHGTSFTLSNERTRTTQIG